MLAGSFEAYLGAEVGRQALPFEVEPLIVVRKVSNVAPRVMIHLRHGAIKGRTHGSSGLDERTQIFSLRNNKYHN